MKQFVVLYVSFLLLIQILLTAGSLQPLEIPISKFLAEISAGIISLFGTDVVHSGITLRHGVDGAAIRVAEVCNALELTLLLFAAILAYPAPFKSKLIGLAFAGLAVQGVNTFRIVSLFYTAEYFPEQFDWIHQYVWGLVIMLDVALCFVAWAFFCGGLKSRDSGLAL